MLHALVSAPRRPQLRPRSKSQSARDQQPACSHAARLWRVVTKSKPSASDVQEASLHIQLSSSICTVFWGKTIDICSARPFQWEKGHSVPCMGRHAQETNEKDPLKWARIDNWLGSNSKLVKPFPPAFLACSDNRRELSHLPGMLHTETV